MMDPVKQVLDTKLKVHWGRLVWTFVMMLAAGLGTLAVLVQLST